MFLPRLELLSQVLLQTERGGTLRLFVLAMVPSQQPPAAPEPDQTPRGKLFKTTPLNATASLFLTLPLRPAGRLVNL